MHGLASIFRKSEQTQHSIVLCKKIRNHNFVDSLGASIGIQAKLSTIISDSIRQFNIMFNCILIPFCNFYTM